MVRSHRGSDEPVPEENLNDVPDRADKKVRISVDVRVKLNTRYNRDVSECKRCHHGSKVARQCGSYFDWQGQQEATRPV